MTRCARSLPLALLPLLLHVVHPGSASAAPPPPIRLVSADGTGVTLEYEAAEPSFRDVSTPFGTFQEISLDGHSIDGELGRPALPSRGAGIAVPEGVTPTLSFEILESTTYEGKKPLPLAEAPVAPDADLLRQEGAVLDRRAYSAGYRDERPQINFEMMGHLRNHRVGHVGVAPFAWDPAAGTLTMIRHARIRIDFTPTGEKPGRAISPAILVPSGYLPVGTEAAFEENYREAFLNYESAKSFRARPVPLRSERTDRGRAEFETASTGAADLGNQEMRLFVWQTGAYYATYSDLAAKGWPAGIPVDQVVLYEKGFNAADPAHPTTTDVPIRIEEADGGTPGVFDGDDTIYFYVLNYFDRWHPTPGIARFSRMNAYWLSWRASGGATMPVDAGWFEAAAPVTPSTYVMHTHFEEDSYYMTDRPESDPQLDYPSVDRTYWLNVSSYQDSLQFQAPGRDTSRPLRLRARWQGLFAGTHYVTIWLKRTCNTAPVGADTLLTSRHPFASGDAYTYDSGYTIPGARLSDGCNELKLQGNGFASSDPFSAGSGAYFDWFEVDYARRYVASGGTLRFTSGSATGDVELAVSELKSGDFRVFDITDSLHPRVVTIDPAQVTQTGTGPNRRWQFRMRSHVTAQKSWLLWEVASIPPLSAAVPTGRLPRDQGTSNIVVDTPDELTADTGANTIVIVHPDFWPTFAAWKAKRESQGYTFRVATPQDIYDQFNGGVKSPYAIRAWLRHVYRYWAKAPDNVVLIGDASEDYRSDVHNPQFASDTDWVPTMMVYGPVDNSVRKELVSTDSWYVGSLAPGDPDIDLFPEMYIGRISVGTTTEAQTMADKLVAYDTYSADDSWRNRGIIVSDDQYSSPLNGFASYCYMDHERLFEAIGDSLQKQFDFRSCYDGFATEHFRLREYLAGLNRPVPGCFDAAVAQNEARRVATPAWVEHCSQGHLFNIYSGHANMAVMTTELFVEYSGAFQSPDARITEQLTNYGKPFIFVGVACHLNQFASYNEGRTKQCLAESMLMLPNRGAIASIASTAYEWVETNRNIELFLGLSLFSRHPLDPETGNPRNIIGEAMYAGLTRAVLEAGGLDFFYGPTIRTYGLLGDPTMRIDMAPPSLKVSVAGAPVSAGTQLRAPAGSDEVDIGVRVADDVDQATSPLAIHLGSTEIPSSEWTSTRWDSSGVGACHGVDINWPAHLQPGNYTVTLTGTDWLGRAIDFPLTVETRTDVRVDNRIVSPGDLLPIDAPIEMRLTSPVALVPGDVDFKVNGELGSFSITQGVDDREWIGTITQHLPEGNVALSSFVRGVQTGSLSIRAQGDFGVEQVYFYPSPWQGDGEAYFTWQLSYREGETPKRARVTVYSISGRKVTTLDGPVGVGRNVLPWNATDIKGDVISNGVYLYKLDIDGASGEHFSTVDRLVIHR